MPGGIPYSKIQQRRYSGTTSATANEQAAVKKVLPPEWKGATRIATIVNGEGVYIEGGNLGLGRSGINCPVAEVLAEAGAVTYSKLVNLSDNVWVAAYDDGGDSTKGKVVVITKSGTTLTVGTPVVFNNAVTTDIDLKKIDATTFVVAYCDDGGSDYLAARIGTVSGTVPTLGTEKEIVAAAVVKTAGVGIAVPSAGVVAATYQLAGDTKHYIVGCPYTGTTFGTAGTPVEVAAAANTVITAESVASGRVVVAYAAVSTGYLNTAVCTVSAAGVCVAGTPEAHSAAATTSITVVKASENRGILSWIDTGDLHLFAFDIAATGTTLNEGADATLAGTHLATCPAMFDDKTGVIAYEDDAHAGKYGTLQPFTVVWAALGSGGTVTLSTVLDIFAQAQSAVVRCAANSANELVLFYKDADDSNATKALYAVKTTGIMDVRSTVASAAYYIDAFPVYEYEKVY